MRGRKRLMLATVGIAGVALLTQWAVGVASPPANPFVRMAPCPDSPNCVSSLAAPTDRVHYSEPLTYTGDMAAAKTHLLAVLSAMPRTTIVEDDGGYLHAEARSLIFRFVDDVEFQFDEANQTIHFRSAARLGRGDLGVNRKRMEEIRAAFAAR